MDALYEIAERPAQRRSPLAWHIRGSRRRRHHRLIAETQEHCRRTHPRDHAALIGLSWDVRPEGFSCLIGYVGEDHATFAASEHTNLPAMRFATTMHHPEGGDVFVQYRKMFDWIEAKGYAVDQTHLHYREEYGAGFVSSSASALRLMVPIR
ncbi:AraC family transcriptional regulator [Sinorhizobium sp. BJ1]|uniref:AraC family transcriptional regulator n=1 Tax=Sinorhizobium sp. BJ1 TaxID=2035455 RepID=UPI001FE10365|nr:AraC family transcriptional regulator [Sinorhizobium sp. BJ1]